MNQIQQRAFLCRELTEQFLSNAHQEMLPPQSEQASDGASYMVARIKDNYVGVPVSAIIAVLPARPCAALPFIKNRHCAGFILYQGSAVPVLDNQRLLGIGTQDRSAVQPHQRVVIFQEQGLRTALYVDAALGLERLVASSESRHCVSKWGHAVLLDIVALTDVLRERVHG